MNIENLEYAVNLHSQLEKLKHMQSIIEEGGSTMIVLHASASRDSECESSWDKALITSLKLSIEARIEDIETIIETL